MLKETRVKLQRLNSLNHPGCPGTRRTAAKALCKNPRTIPEQVDHLTYTLFLEAELPNRQHPRVLVDLLCAVGRAARYAMDHGIVNDLAEISPLLEKLIEDENTSVAFAASLAYNDIQRSLTPF